MKPSELPQAPTATMLPAALELLGIDPDETHAHWYVTEDREMRFAVASPIGLLVYAQHEVVPHRPSFRLKLLALTPWREVRCLVGSTTSSEGEQLASGLSLTIDGLPDRIDAFTNDPETVPAMEFAQACLLSTMEARGTVNVEARDS